EQRAGEYREPDAGNAQDVELGADAARIIEIAAHDCAPFHVALRLKRTTERPCSRFISCSTRCTFLSDACVSRRAMYSVSADASRASPLMRTRPVATSGCTASSPIVLSD